jgi:Ca2+-binding RTX toxin-like protein
MGGAGDDELYGENGKDVLEGGDGNDKLYGGNGEDILKGGAGDDKLYGENGKDTFVIGAGEGHDNIYGFHKDTIDLSGTGLTWGDLDTNGNNTLDAGDAYVTIGGGNTIIDLGAAGGGIGGIDTLTVDVTGLKDDSFIFS